jgi:hypothetical protein
LADGVQALAASGSNPGVVFAGTHAGGVFKNVAMLTLDRMDYCVGSSWKLSIVNAPANAAIRLVGVSNGVPWEWSAWGTTDNEGKYPAS